MDGLEDDEATFIGFGGQRIGRRLEIDDEFYLVLHCKVVSTGRSKKKSDADGLKFSAGVATTIISEIDPGTAARFASDHG